MWMIRNGGGEYAEDFIDKGYVGIGWSATGSLASLKTRDQFIDKVKTTWPGFKHMKAVVSGSQLHKMAVVIKPKDRVITYDPSTRMYHVGVIESDYIYKSDDKNERINQRKVKWLHKIERDRLSVQTKNSLGSTLTIFEVPEVAERELDALLRGEEHTREEAKIDPSNEALDEQVCSMITSHGRRSLPRIKSSLWSGIRCRDLSRGFCEQWAIRHAFLRKVLIGEKTSLPHRMD
jgi:restriction system protein